MKYRIDDLILELHSIHKQLNKFLFSSTLSEIKISIETSKRKRQLTLGHFDPSGDWQDKRNQITIWTLALNGDYNQIIEVLIHEMVHQYCFENNLKDVENNQRHNKKFLRIATDKAGLIVKKNEKRGFSDTSLSQELENYIETELDFNKNVFKKMVHSDALNYKPKGYNKNNRYICKGCKTVINNSRETKLNIKCLDCNKVFKLV